MKEKSKLYDNWEAQMIKKPSRIHDGLVSMKDDQFHFSSGYVYDYATNDGSRFGVDKKAWKASGYGVNVDGNNVGKSKA